MAPRRVTVLDLVSKGPTRRLYHRLMNANLASIMPQVAAVWATELGHQVRFICYTGQEGLTTELLHDTDVVLISAYSRSAQTAYALSNLFRRQGAITVLGGPHARCYPQDAAKYFDYVLGFTDKPLLAEVLRDAAPHRPVGVQLSARQQPRELPGVEERWPFIAPTIAKAPAFAIVPMIGSMGCPYTCSFCIDSVVPYQPLSYDLIRQDLRFLRTKVRKPNVSWHDPNFGVRFDDYMDAIESAVPPRSVRFVAESSLALLSEPHLKRLQKNGFIGMLPGIESWFSLGNKSKTGTSTGMAKVEQVADHINMVLRHIPYVQANFVLGLDCDEGPEPFELTKRFMDLAPGAYPVLSLFTSYGQAAPLNLELQRSGRVLPVPFQLLDNHTMNLRPKNYGWSEFYSQAADVVRYAVSKRQVLRRLVANGLSVPGLVNAARGMSSRRIRYWSQLAERMQSDGEMQRFFAGESRKLPSFLEARIRRGLGELWDALSPGALMHNETAYAEAEAARASRSPAKERIERGAPPAPAPLMPAAVTAAVA